MNAWDMVKDEIERKAAEGGKFLKLQKDGDKAVVAFIGDPIKQDVAFDENGSKLSVEEAKARKIRLRTSILINVGILENGRVTGEVKIIDKGVQFFKDLLLVRNKYGLDKWAFEVRRNGAAKDPKTTYSILPEKQLTDEDKRALQALPIYDLNAADDDPAPPARDSDTAFPHGANAPASAPADQAFARELKAIVDGLRALPDPQAGFNRLALVFNVRKVSELAPNQIEKALQYVHLLAEDGVPQPEELDPFA